MDKGGMLPRAARELVVSGILAGYTDRLINKSLAAAGFAAIGDSECHRIRSSAMVRRSFEERTGHVCQQGIGDRERRVLKLIAVADRLERRIMAGGTLEDSDAEDLLDEQSFKLFDRYMATLKQISGELEAVKAGVRAERAGRVKGPGGLARVRGELGSS